MSAFLGNSKSKMVNKKKTQFKEMHQHKNLYSQILITRTVSINIINIGNTIKETLEKTIAAQIEGKCIVEGYIKPRTVEVLTFSSGLVMSSNVIFEVVIQCEVCSPVEGMHINCIAKHINKAGIRAEIRDTPSPVVIFIARDHNYASPFFAGVKENDEIKVRVIGQRFELNDKYISIIAEIIETNALTEKTSVKQQPQNTTTIHADDEPAGFIHEPAGFIHEPAGFIHEPDIISATALSITKKKARIRIKQPKITVKN